MKRMQPRNLVLTEAGRELVRELPPYGPLPELRPGKRRSPRSLVLTEAGRELVRELSPGREGDGLNGG